MSKKVLKSVLITGASSGIGATYAERFARRGHDLVLVARNGDRMRATAEQASRRRLASRSTSCRPTSPFPPNWSGSQARLRNDARIGILINNAGAVLPGGFLDADSAAQDWLLRLNVAAPTRLAHAFIPRFLAEGGRRHRQHRLGAGAGARNHAGHLCRDQELYADFLAIAADGIRTARALRSGRAASRDAHRNLGALRAFGRSPFPASWTSASSSTPRWSASTARRP